MINSHQTTAVMSTHPPARVEFESIPRNKVYREVARQLERRITEGLKPGDLLPPERELVQMLGVSRGCVRDAIRSLELMGLLEPRQSIGTMVRDPAEYAAAGPTENSQGVSRSPNNDRAAAGAPCGHCMPLPSN